MNERGVMRLLALLFLNYFLVLPDALQEFVVEQLVPMAVRVMIMVMMMMHPDNAETYHVERAGGGQDPWIVAGRW
jgi:uncharacterized membrane protein